MDGGIHEIEKQHLLDLQDGSSFGSDPKSWLSSDDDVKHKLSSISAAATTASASGSVDRVLFNNLVELVPLVQTLIDRRANSSFRRRGSMNYTKTLSREFINKKKNAGRTTKKPRDQGDKDQNKDSANNQEAENFSVFSSSTLLSEKDREELMALSDEIDDLKRLLSDKSELLQSAPLLKDEMASIDTKYDELQSEAALKDSVIKSTQLQLSDLKVKLSDKQAAVEKLHWEATTSNKEVERLQGDLDKVQGELSSFLLLIEGLTRNDFVNTDGDYDDFPYLIDQNHEIDDEMDMKELDAAREAYINAVAAAKEKQDEESLSAAVRARFHLQWFCNNPNNRQQIQTLYS